MMHRFPNTWVLMHCIPVQGITVLTKSELILRKESYFSITTVKKRIPPTAVTMRNQVVLASTCHIQNTKKKQLRSYNFLLNPKMVIRLYFNLQLYDCNYYLLPCVPR